MAEKKEIQQAERNTNKLASRIQGLMDTLYQRNYYSPSKSKTDLEVIRTNMKKSIDNIVDNNMENIGVPNISKIYARLDDAQSDKDTIGKIEEMFSDETLTNQMMSAYMGNKYLIDLDLEIDTVCKYLPKLEEAIETRKDNVLSADHFTKDFITVENPDIVGVDDTTSADRIDVLKEKYELQDNFEIAYYKASKYGEQFVYVVPYKKALAKLLSLKNKPLKTECVIDFKKKLIFSESAEPQAIILEGVSNEKTSQFIENSDIKFLLEFNESYMINESVLDYKNNIEKLNSIREQSLCFDESASKSIGESKVEKTFDKTIYDDLSMDSFYTGVKGQELIIGSDNTDKILAAGAIQKFLDRQNVIPIYVDNNICMGYYYLEMLAGVENNMFLNSSSTGSGNMAGSVMNKNSLPAQTITDSIEDDILKSMSKQLSTAIDAKFINNNQDLTKEIYSILKANDLYNLNTSGGMRVTFIPPEDMIHFCFKKDEKTHRGQSDLAKALLPAKMYAGLYITNTIATMTRGQDKRVYYVKQSIDTNISKNLLNTINQIKKANFGIRQIDSNIESVLNITGRFNDYVIPVNSSGDSPIQFEIMPGQNIDIKTELMNILEELAVNATDVPLEIIQARQSIDYAISLTMTNSRFLRKVYNRQGKCNKLYTEWITKLYRAEFEDIKTVKVSLPPPMFLNITNVNQVFNNGNEYANSITEMEMSGETNELVKAIFKKEILKTYLGSYIDISMISEIRKRAEREAERIGLKNKAKIETEE